MLCPPELLWEPPRPCLSCPCQAGDAHLDPHCKLGSHWWHQCPPNSSPVLTNPSSHSLGVRFFSPFFSPSFSSRSHRDLCKDLGASLGLFGVSRWSPGSVPGGISQGGTDFRQPRTKCCQASFAFCFFCFFQDKNWKTLGAISMDIALSSRAREQLGLPSLHFLQNQGCVLFIIFFLSLRKEQSFICRYGEGLYINEVITFFFLIFVGKMRVRWQLPALGES